METWQKIGKFEVGKRSVVVGLLLLSLSLPVFTTGCGGAESQPIAETTTRELPPGWVFEQVEGVDGMVLISEAVVMKQAYTYYQLQTPLLLEQITTDLNTLIPAISEAALAIYTAASTAGQVFLQGVLMPAEIVVSLPTGIFQDACQGPWKIPIMKDGEFLGWQYVDRSRYPVLQEVHMVQNADSLQQTIEETQAQERGAEARDPEQITAAFVDDDPYFASTRMEWLTELLSLTIPNLHHYQTCADLLTAMRTGQTYDIIYTDTNLDLDTTFFTGYKCTAAIREMEQRMAIPPAIIIGMSAVGHGQDLTDYQDSYRRMGAQGFVDKVSGPEAMAEATRQLLNLP